MTVVVYIEARYKLSYMVLWVQGICESSKSTGAHDSAGSVKYETKHNLLVTYSTLSCLLQLSTAIHFHYQYYL